MGSFQTGGGYQPADPALVQVLTEAAARSPYNVVMFSGDRDGTSASQHDTGNAVDIVLIDPSTGQEIPNLANGEAFPIYEQFAHTARAVQQQIAPQLADTFRWGGYFGPSNLNPDGADLMHFDLGPTANMRMGSWDGGLNAEGQQFVANLGQGQIYSASGQRAAPAGVAYNNLWGGGSGQPMAYAGTTGGATTGAAGAAERMAAGGDSGLPTLRRGAGSSADPDANVRSLQEFLNQNGANVHVDGDFGPMTERAVRAYQETNGLEVDGIVGPETWGHIAGTAAVAGGATATAGSLPGPVRNFVQRMFGDSAIANLADRVALFRQGISKGMSPIDAFTQARGQPIRATPAPGSATAMLPPKSGASPIQPVIPNAPVSAAAPAAATNTPLPAGGMRASQVPPAPVIPGNPAQPFGVGALPGATAGVQPAGAPPAVAGDGLVNRSVPAATVGDSRINRAGPPLTNPALMPRGSPVSTVPTQPPPNSVFDDGEYFRNEQALLMQPGNNAAAMPRANMTPADPGAMQRQTGPRADGRSIMPLGRQPGYVPPEPVQTAFDDQQFANTLAAESFASKGGLNPQAIVAGMPQVSLPAAGWGPQPPTSGPTSGPGAGGKPVMTNATTLVSEPNLNRMPAARDELNPYGTPLPSYNEPPKLTAPQAITGTPRPVETTTLPRTSPPVIASKPVTAAALAAEKAAAPPKPVVVVVKPPPPPKPVPAPVVRKVA
jgi:peptidoglycan hydrolase-like protein with peptidoglycan-binding domain